MIDGETRAGCVYVWRQDPDAVRRRGYQGVTHAVWRVGEAVQHGSPVVQRVVRLEIGRPVGDVGVGNCVRLVETVAAEGEDVCEQVARFCLCMPFLLGTLYELLFGVPHNLRHLLAHGLAQDVCLAKRVSCELPGDEHDLVLIDDHAVRFLEDVLQARVRVCNRRAAVLGVDELIDVLHRPWTVQGDHGCDVQHAAGL